MDERTAVASSDARCWASSRSHIGNAAGPFLGGLAINADLGYTSPTAIAALLGTGGLLFALLSGAADRREHRRTASGPAPTQPPAGYQADVSRWSCTSARITAPHGATEELDTAHSNRVMIGTLQNRRSP